MEDNLDSVGVELVSDTWNKVLRDCKQIGFREGAFDGQEVNFQKSFDVGVSNTNKTVNKNLKDTRKALCVICEKPKLLESSEKEVIEIQEAKMENTEKELQD